MRPCSMSRSVSILISLLFCIRGTIPFSMIIWSGTCTGTVRLGASIGSERTRHVDMKRKATEAAPAPAPKRRGGGGRGAGRKPSDLNRPGVDAATAPKRKQQGLADLLGPRFAKKAVPADANGELTAMVEDAVEQPLLSWEALPPI